MNKFYTIAILTMLFSCCNKQTVNDIELVVENDTLRNIDDTHPKVNVLRYYLRNNSDKCYYINNICENTEFRKMGIRSNNLNIYIYDNHEKEIKYNLNYFKDTLAQCVYPYLMKNAKVYQTSLEYNKPLKFYTNFGFSNFFIHPKETIYFEYPIDLSGPVGFEAVRIGYAKLDKDKRYFGKISLISDSVAYKDVLPRDILQTIKSNNAQVFHGTIQSKKIPIKILNR